MANKNFFLIHHIEGYEAIERRVGNVGEAVAKAVANDAEDMAPIKTGRLVSSIGVVRAGSFKWYVTVTADHWDYIEYGTLGRNPIILPKYKRALWWPGLPRPIAKVTKHPGNKAQPFMRPALYQRRFVWITPTGGVAVST